MDYNFYHSIRTGCFNTWLESGTVSYFIYPIIELFFGVSLLLDVNHRLINELILVAMGFSTLGVITSLIKKQNIECACLGTIFNVPLATVTLLEDLLMVGMAALMLIIL